MPTLTAATRKKIPGSKFALPGRRYPIENRSHAVDAKGRAKQEWQAGKLSAEEYKTVVGAANRKLARKGR